MAGLKFYISVIDSATGEPTIQRKGNCSADLHQPCILFSVFAPLLLYDASLSSREYARGEMPIALFSVNEGKLCLKWGCMQCL